MAFMIGYQVVYLPKTAYFFNANNKLVFKLTTQEHHPRFNFFCS